MDRLSQRLDDGSARFSAFEQKFTGVEETHRDHGERLVRLETLFGAMDGKLDIIVNHIKGPR